MNSAQTPFPTVLQKGPSFPNKNVLIIIIAMVLVALGSYYLGAIKPLPLPGTGAVAYEKDLPFSLALLKNPLIDQWSAAVKGKLVTKSADSITLQDDKGNSITIPLRISEDKRTWTKFFIIKKGEQTPKNVSVDQIPTGVFLSGDFFILPTPHDKNRVVGSSFVYDEQSQK